MTIQIIDIGSGPSAGDGDSLRTSFSKVNANFAELQAGQTALLSSQVTSVAGRTGAVTLSVSDITDAASVTYVDNAIVSDHGLLIGLENDDHSQYVLNNGATRATIDIGLTPVDGYVLTWQTDALVLSEATTGAVTPVSYDFTADINAGETNSVVIVPSNGEVQYTTLAAALDVSFDTTGLIAGNVYHVVLEIDHGLDFAVNWAGNVVWAGNVTPTGPFTNGVKEVYELYTRDAGITWVGRHN